MADIERGNHFSESSVVLQECLSENLILWKSNICKNVANIWSSLIARSDFILAAKT